jgi:hypothetical protein
MCSPIVCGSAGIRVTPMSNACGRTTGIASEGSANR